MVLQSITQDILDIIVSYVKLSELKQLRLVIKPMKKYEIHRKITIRNDKAFNMFIFTNIIILNNKIRYLPNYITRLYCYYNTEITNISLGFLKKLQYLNCGTNTNFTNYGLRNLRNLTYLDCGRNTNFTDEALQYLVNLEYLHCGNNTKFTNAGLQYLKNLTFLHCFNNQNFTDIGLQCLTNLQYLVCGYNVKFTSNALRYLPNLRYIDTGINTDIIDPNIVRHLPNLVYIIFNSNLYLLASLHDVTHISYSIYIDIPYNYSMYHSILENYRHVNDGKYHFIQFRSISDRYENQ